MAEKQENTENNEKETVIETSEVSEGNDTSSEVPNEENDSMLRKSKKNKAAEELEELQIKHAELKDKHLRLFAEFDNFRKRNAKERLELIQTAGKDIIIDILPVIDDFQRAMDSSEDAKDTTAVVEGMKLIYHKLENTLKNKGLQVMESIGEDFDSEIHEAVAEVPVEKKGMKGKVIDEVEKGYLLNDKIIRFAKVVVGK
ncbi:MAG: nucleotide exchange factor GrpE [Chitinophagales bacterium]|nr:nucleotide exchange factor GrpE [Chitinophagales bacterium]